MRPHVSNGTEPLGVCWTGGECPPRPGSDAGSIECRWMSRSECVTADDRAGFSSGHAPLRRNAARVLPGFRSTSDRRNASIARMSGAIREHAGHDETSDRASLEQVGPLTEAGRAFFLGAGPEQKFTHPSGHRGTASAAVVRSVAENVHWIPDGHLLFDLPISQCPPHGRVDSRRRPRDAQNRFLICTRRNPSWSLRPTSSPPTGSTTTRPVPSSTSKTIRYPFSATITARRLLFFLSLCCSATRSVTARDDTQG